MGLGQLLEHHKQFLASQKKQNVMINNRNQAKAKPPCAVCQAVRRTMFLAAGLGIFAFFAYSPNYRADADLASLLEYLTLENALYAMCIAIAAKLALGAVKEFMQK